jgi:hypothetical protein
MAKVKSQHGGPRPGSGRPKTSDRDDVTVRLDRHVTAQARFVADSRGITLAEYLSDALRPIVVKDFAKASKEQLGGGGQ